MKKYDEKMTFYIKIKKKKKKKKRIIKFINKFFISFN